MIIKVMSSCQVYYSRVVDFFDLRVDNLCSKPDFLIKDRKGWESLIIKLLEGRPRFPSDINEIYKMLESSDKDSRILGLSIIFRQFSYADILILKKRMLNKSQSAYYDSTVSFLENLLWVMNNENSN